MTGKKLSSFVAEAHGWGGKEDGKGCGKQTIVFSIHGRCHCPTKTTE